MQLANEKSQNSNPGHLALEGTCLTVLYCFSVIAHYYKMQILIHIKQKSITIQMWLIRESTIVSKGFFFFLMDKLQDEL